METISFSEGNNVGGLSTLYMAFYQFFKTIYPVSFKPGYDWTAIEFLPESASCKYNAAQVDNGIEHSYSLVFGFNKQSQPLYDAFARYIGDTGILKFTDNNGLTRLLGTKKNRVIVKQEGDTGNNPADLNYLKLTVTWVHHRPGLVI